MRLAPNLGVPEQEGIRHPRGNGGHGLQTGRDTDRAERRSTETHGDHRPHDLDLRECELDGCAV